MTVNDGDRYGDSNGEEDYLKLRTSFPSMGSRRLSEILGAYDRIASVPRSLDYGYPPPPPEPSHVDKMKVAVRKARSKILEQNEMLEELTSAPYVYAPVVSTGSAAKVVQQLKKGSKVLVDGNLPATVRLPDYLDSIVVRYDNSKLEEPIYDYDRIEPVRENYNFVVVALEGKHTEVLTPKRLALVPGDIVKLDMKTLQVIDIATISPVGEVAFVNSEPIGNHVEVDHQGTSRVVHIGKQFSLERGDRVMLDASFSVIMQNLGKREDRFTYQQSTNVTWNEIGGLQEAKAQMVEAIEAPHRHPELYKFYGKKPVKGILLYGPPRCGKTMLGKAASTSLSQIYGRQTSSGFMYIKGPEILEKWVGAAEATIRQIFERARRHYQAEGYPAVIFIDEADAIMGRRGAGISSDINNTIVPMFLTEMDGLEESGALVILATNRPDTLDPAIVGEGRIDRKIRVGRPSQEDAVDIFKLYLAGIPVNGSISIDALAESAAAELFSPEHVVNQFKLEGQEEEVHDLTLVNLVNGGMIAAIVDQATSFALNRDIASGTRAGIQCQDLINAVKGLPRQNKDLNLHDAIVDFISSAAEATPQQVQVDQEVNLGQYL